MRPPLTIKAFFLALAWALTVLAPLRLAFAQDAASAPFHQPPTPTPEATATPPSERPPPLLPERKPAPQPTVAATATPSPKPERKAAAKEERENSPAPAPKRTATPKPVQRDVPETSGDQDSIAGTVKRLENEWESSIVNHDTSVIQKLVADDFTGVSSSGKIGDKLTMIYEAKRDQSVYKSAAARKMYVHNFGPHVAVAMGLTRETGTAADGRAFDRSYRFTDTWVERDGKWQCVAAHATAVPKR